MSFLYPWFSIRITCPLVAAPLNSNMNSVQCTESSAKTPEMREINQNVPSNDRSYEDCIQQELIIKFNPDVHNLLHSGIGQP